MVTANDAEGAGNTFTVTTLDIANMKNSVDKTSEEIFKDDFLKNILAYILERCDAELAFLEGYTKRHKSILHVSE